MRYGAIKNRDIANGPGVRVVLFVSGCTHHCKGCFQPQTWDFDYGDDYTADTEQEIIDALAPDFMDGLTLLGGEPMEPENQRGLVDFIERVRARFPRGDAGMVEKTIWCFTGDTLDELMPGAHHHTEERRGRVDHRIQAVATKREMVVAQAFFVVSGKWWQRQ